jgi:hypothetical protein
MVADCCSYGPDSGLNDRASPGDCQRGPRAASRLRACHLCGTVASGKTTAYGFIHLRRSPLMMINVMLQPLIALIAGILILLVPRLLNYIVAIYLIIVGIVGLWPHILA